MNAVVLRKLRSVITFGLIGWCAGAGCMLVSYAHSAQMSVEATPSSSSKAVLGQASGSAGSHDCCKARHASEHRGPLSMMKHAAAPGSLANSEELSEVPNSSDAMSCCPLTSGTIVMNGRQRISTDNTSLARDVNAVSLAKASAGTAPVILARTPNQTQTYLRACVFLI